MWNDEYVDFFQILFQTPEKYAYVDKEGAEGPTLEKQVGNKRRMSFLHWCLAFDIYAEAFCDFFPSAERDIRAYGFHIKRMMTNGDGYAWGEYDVWFRKNRAELRLPYCALEVTMSVLSSRGIEQNVVSGSKGVGQHYRRRSRSPAGRRARRHSPYPRRSPARFNSKQVCFKWNNGGNCPGCRFQHRCQRCYGSHPLASCTKTPSQRGAAGHSKAAVKRQ